MEKPNKKQVYSLVSLVLSVAIFGLALYVFITSVSARSKNGQAEIFGYSFAIVVTDSMSPEIKVGDLIIVKSCDITDIKEGDNAVFLGLNGTFKDKRVVHRVVGVYEGVNEIGDKSIYLETWGISNPKYDDDYVYSTNFIGKEIFHSTFLGAIMSFLRVPINWLYLVIIFGVIYFAVKQSKNIIKLVKDKGQKPHEDLDVTKENDAHMHGESSQDEEKFETEEVTESQEKAPLCKIWQRLKSRLMGCFNSHKRTDMSEIDINAQEQPENSESKDVPAQAEQKELAVPEEITKSDEITECQEKIPEGQEELVTDIKDDITNDKDIESNQR
ncbi:MAG: signal peptidase I [Clostridiales bacterium]|nr:signal peptidase I [Clostridiales bacterium]